MTGPLPFHRHSSVPDASSIALQLARPVKIVPGQPMLVPPKPKHRTPDARLPQLLGRLPVSVLKCGIVLMVGQKNQPPPTAVRLDHIRDPVDNTLLQPAVATDAGNAVHPWNPRQDRHPARVIPSVETDNLPVVIL